MLTAVLVVCAVVFTLLAAGAWVGLAEFLIKALFGRSAVGTVIRLDPCPVYVRRQIAVLQFETDAGPVQVASDGIWTGPAFLRVGNTHTVRYWRNPARAVIVDLSELFQRVVGVVLTTPLAVGFLGWAWVRGGM